MDENESLVLLLVGLWLVSKYSFEIVPKLEKSGATLYDTLHDDAGHKQDLPAREEPEQLTPMTAAHAKLYLNAALHNALGRDPTEDEISMLMAQSDFETAGWQKLHNYNFGNLEVTSGHPWYRLRGNPQRFRSYVNANEGATGMVFLIKNRYPQAFALLGSRDTFAYAKALKDRGYYTADLSAYAAGLKARYGRS